MMDYLSIEFLVAALFFINVFLVVFVLLLLRRINRLNFQMSSQYADFRRSSEGAAAAGSAREIMGLLEPLVKESKKAADSFDEQVTEKKRLLKELNDALDTRVININLMLSRAETLHKKLEAQQAQLPEESVNREASVMNRHTSPLLDQQHQIIDMYRRKIDIDTIARQLAVPKGEIQLVIDLKEKFLAMEKDDR